MRSGVHVAGMPVAAVVYEVICLAQNLKRPFQQVSHWLSPHRTTLPVRVAQVTAAPWLDLVATVVYKMLYVMGSNGLQHQLVPWKWTQFLWCVTGRDPVAKVRPGALVLFVDDATCAPNKHSIM